MTASRALQSAIGLAMIATDLAAILLGRDLPGWLHVALLAGGGHLVSKSLMKDLTATAISTVRELMKAKNAGGGNGAAPNP